MSSDDFDAQKRDRDDVIFTDKRANPRFNHKLKVDFEVSDEGPHTFFAGITQDISKGGVFLVTHQIYPVGTDMILSFMIEGVQLKVDAVVRWTREPDKIQDKDILPGMGLQFINPGKEVVNAFEKFLEKKDTLLVDMD